MRTRAIFAVAFVAIVGGLIVLRDHGYLGGRTLDGPLHISGARGAATALSRSDTVFLFELGGRLRGKPVQVQNVRSRVVSPELEVLGPNVATRATSGFGTWPPASAPTALEGSALRDAHPSAVVGLRAQRSGVYYALGLIADYRRGQRRYRDRESQRLCIAISKRQRCNRGYPGPHGARVAQVGGPARYPRAGKLTPRTVTYEGTGHYSVSVTLANQTRSVIDVSELEFDPNPLGAAITSTEPQDFRLPPHGYQVVRLSIEVPAGCRGTRRFPRLRARLDKQRRSVPLSLPLRFTC